MDNWIEWTGGERPVSSTTMVDTRQRCGNQYFGFSAGWTKVGHWDRIDRERHTDIVAYRLVTPSHG